MNALFSAIPKEYGGTLPGSSISARRLVEIAI